MFSGSCRSCVSGGAIMLVVFETVYEKLQKIFEGRQQGL